MTQRQLLDQAILELKKTELGYRQLAPPATGHWAAALKLLADLRATFPPAAPPKRAVVLGPVVPGGQPILDQDLTHVTDGMTAGGSVWPALDDGVGHPGLKVLAPEPVTITGHGRATRRDGSPDGQSINIARGASGMEYWIGHLEQPAAVGAKIPRGGRLGVISPNHEAPHVHLGINARPLLGHDLAHHVNYTHGATRIGVQLRAAGFPTD